MITKKHYLLYRAFFIVSIVLCFCILFPGFFLVLALSPNTFLSVLPLFFLFVCLFGIVVLMIFNLTIFGSHYSLIGELEKTPFPNEKPMRKMMGWGGIGAGLIIPWWSIWTVYPSGLGLQMFVLGQVFIPTAKIIELKTSSTSLLLFLTPYELKHESEEIQNPIYLPPYKRLFDELNKLKTIQKIS